jgi:hypothetical protein
VNFLSIHKCRDVIGLLVSLITAPSCAENETAPQCGAVSNQCVQVCLDRSL